MRAIIDTDPRHHVLLLAALAGVGKAMNTASMRSLGDEISVPVIIFSSLVVGAIGGIIGLYIWGVLLRWTGSWLGGSACSAEVRAGIAWSSVPVIWAMLLWIPELALFGKEMFTYETPRIDDSLTLSLTLLGFGVTEVAIGIWWFVVFLKCIGEVHAISAWKALGASLLAGLVLVGPFLLVFVLILIAEAS